MKLAVIRRTVGLYKTGVSLIPRVNIICGAPRSTRLLSRMSESKLKKPYQPTPEQLALAEERRQKKAALKAAQKETEKREQDDRSRIFPREWLPITKPAPKDLTTKVMTWNVSYISS